MAYKVGQKRQLPDNNDANSSTSLNSYYSKIENLNKIYIQTKNPYRENETFMDFALQRVLTTTNESGETQTEPDYFREGQVYFLRIIFGKQHKEYGEEGEVNKLSYLLKLREGSNQQLLSSFSIDAAATSQKEYYTYSLIFKPNSNYSLLLFELQKVGYDFLHTNDPDNRREWESIDYSTNGIICKLNNIINRQYDKIGFQSRPGELIAINGSPIRVGRSGIYELDNGTPINSIMIAPNASNQIDAYLLDYMYEQNEEEE